MSPLQVPGGGFVVATAGSLTWGAEMQPIKKKREGQGPGLRMPLFTYLMQQPTKIQCRQWGEDFRRDLTGADCVGGTFSRRLGWQIKQQKN
jgi:hypothetical protein